MLHRSASGWRIQSLRRCQPGSLLGGLIGYLGIVIDEGEAAEPSEDSQMAKKKGLKKGPSTQQPPPAVPNVYGEPETNPVLCEQKAFVLKTLNFQHKSVTRQRDLGICLFALGRKADALQVLRYAYRHIQFRGSYRVWYSAASACRVYSYLRRTNKDSARTLPDFRRFLHQPAHGIQLQPKIWTASFVEQHIEGERKRFEVRFEDPKHRVALEAVAWWIATLIFFREMAMLGFPREGKLDLKRLDLWIDDAFKRIRERLKPA
jgi:hypothetical protein